MFIKSRIYLDDEYVVMTRNYFLQYTQLEILEFHDTLIQHMESVKKSIDERAQHKQEYDSMVNDKQMQTIEEMVDTSKALDASLVDKKAVGHNQKSRIQAADQEMMHMLMMHISDPYMMKSQWLMYKRLLKSISLLQDNSILSNLNSILKESNENDGSDSENLIRRIESANTPYPVTQGTTKRDDVKSKHLYSASANKIDEKKPEMKNLPQHLEYAYLYGGKSFPIIISSELSEKEKISLLQDSSKYLSLWRIKKRLPSPVLMGLSLTDECRLDYVMLLQLFKDAWRKSSTTWWKSLWKFLWKTSRYLVTLLILANLDRMPARSKRTRNQGLLGGFYFSKDLTLRLRIKKGADNLAADHLSRLENPNLRTFTEEEITDEFLDEHLMILKAELNNDEPCSLHAWPPPVRTFADAWPLQLGPVIRAWLQGVLCLMGLRCDDASCAGCREWVASLAWASCAAVVEGLDICRLAAREMCGLFCADVCKGMMIGGIGYPTGHGRLVPKVAGAKLAAANACVKHYYLLWLMLNGTGSARMGALCFWSFLPNSWALVGRAGSGWRPLRSELVLEGNNWVFRVVLRSWALLGGKPAGVCAFAAGADKYELASCYGNRTPVAQMPWLNNWHLRGKRIWLA
ncbi:hypothetical protein Tco_1556395 [Tanacetum coccineum]